MQVSSIQNQVLLLGHLPWPLTYSTYYLQKFPHGMRVQHSTVQLPISPCRIPEHTPRFPSPRIDHERKEKKKKPEPLYCPTAFSMAPLPIIASRIKTGSFAQ